ncbi:hypothetical protein Goari_016623 [Gossypium aridum]|uniref:Cytochrome P450 n=1 Tax=Gossypium aridum TaxID=34290 RepID=A0A7J8WJL6_GOSAI|nr:hypothetical protein [Gossypium aridum]
MRANYMPHKFAAQPTLAAMADKYGPALAACPGSNAEKYLAYDHASFGFAPHEPFWREMHKFTVVQILSTHKLTRLNHVRVSEVTALMKDSYSFCKKKEQAILMCGSLKLNMILRLITGKRYFSNAKGEDDKEVNLVMKVCKQFSYLMGVNAISKVVPFLKWMDN